MDKAHFEQLAKRLRPKITVLAGRFFAAVERAEQADDVAQETLLRLWRMGDRIDGYRDVEALAVAIAKNVCVDIYRRGAPTADTIDNVRIAVAAAAVAVLGYFIVRPAGGRDAAATQLASVAAVTQPTPATEYIKTSASPESTVAATPRKQTAIARRHRAAGESSTEASGGGTDPARVLDVASASCVNASIERKGNVFWVSSAAADGTVNVCIIDASNASDVAVYALSDADRPDAERDIGAETDVHGPNL